MKDALWAGGIATAAFSTLFAVFCQALSGPIVTGAFQVLGNSIPFAASMSRIFTFVVPVSYLAFIEGLSLIDIWRFTVASTVIHMALCLFLLKREFRRRFVATSPTEVAI